MGKLITEDEFIRRAQEIHKNTDGSPKFYYYKVKYVNMKIAVIIVCPIHGEFLQTPDNHLQGKQCVKCSKIKPQNQLFIDFKNKSDLKFNKKFDHSKVTYINCFADIILICPSHGEIITTPDNHLRSQYGCILCALDDRQYTTEKFIEKAIAVHGNTYNYSKVVYKKYSEKIHIICPIHGDFWQTPKSHLMGVGCGKCSAKNRVIVKEKNNLLKNEKEKIKTIKKERIKTIKKQKIKTIKKERISTIKLKNENIHREKIIKHNSSRNKMTTEEFIKRAISIHGNKFDYSKSIYVDSKTKIIIICPIHGEFTQLPHNHLIGKRCSKCSGTHRYSTEEIVAEFIKIHGDKYDYSLVIYLKTCIKVDIICNKCHQIFKQTPNKHLMGRGCPNCNTLGTVSEPKLFNKIKNEFNNCLIERGAKPEWLNPIKLRGGQRHLDIYFPEHNIAIEYQGSLHFKCDEFMGGERALDAAKIRDKNKYNICKENNCKLFYFTYDTRYLPDDYEYKMYSKEEDLINEINKLLF